MVTTVVATAAPGFATQTMAPVPAADGVAVVRSAGMAVRVPLTTVVPAPAVTVPVITTGTAVDDWPPPIQTTRPVALTLGPAVVTLNPETDIVPLTTAETERPGTTLTI